MRRCRARPAPSPSSWLHRWEAVPAPGTTLMLGTNGAAGSDRPVANGDRCSLECSPAARAGARAAGGDQGPAQLLRLCRRAQAAGGQGEARTGVVEVHRPPGAAAVLHQLVARLAGMGGGHKMRRLWRRAVGEGAQVVAHVGVLRVHLDLRWRRAVGCSSGGWQWGQLVGPLQRCAGGEGRARPTAGNGGQGGWSAGRTCTSGPCATRPACPTARCCSAGLPAREGGRQGRRSEEGCAAIRQLKAIALAGDSAAHSVQCAAALATGWQPGRPGTDAPPPHRKTSWRRASDAPPATGACCAARSSCPACPPGCGPGLRPRCSSCRPSAQQPGGVRHEPRQAHAAHAPAASAHPTLVPGGGCAARLLRVRLPWAALV